MRKPSFRARKNDDPETRIQCRAAAELRLAFKRRGFTKPPFFHPVNEGWFPVQYRAKLAGKGLETGVPDLVIVYPVSALTRPAPGSVLELKAPGESASPDQEAWLEFFARAGWYTDVCVGHAQTADTLTTLGYISVEQRASWLTWAERADSAAL